MSVYIENITLEQRTPRIRKSKKRRLIGLKDFIAPTILFSTLIFQLWLRIEIIEKGYKLESSREIALKNDAQLRELQMQLAKLTHHTNLENKASSL